MTSTTIAENGYRYIISPDYNNNRSEALYDLDEEPVSFFGKTDDKVFMINSKKCKKGLE